MATAIVLGGNGLVGTATTRVLLGTGWEVTCTGLSKNRFPPDLRERGGRFVRSNRYDPAHLRRVLHDGADIVVDCVGYAAAHSRMLLGHIDSIGSVVLYLERPGRSGAHLAAPVPGSGGSSTRCRTARRDQRPLPAIAVEHRPWTAAVDSLGKRTRIRWEAEFTLMSALHHTKVELALLFREVPHADGLKYRARLKVQLEAAQRKLAAVPLGRFLCGADMTLQSNP